MIATSAKVARALAVIALRCPGCGAEVDVPASIGAPLTCRPCRLRLEPFNAPPEVPRGADGVPAGLPRSVSVANACRALNWTDGMLRGRMDRGAIRYAQDERSDRSRRYPYTSELARLEADGFPVDWDALAELTL